jgi:hypothetical protein
VIRLDRVLRLRARSVDLPAERRHDATLERLEREAEQAEAEAHRMYDEAVAEQRETRE